MRISFLCTFPFKRAQMIESWSGRRIMIGEMRNWLATCATDLFSPHGIWTTTWSNGGIGGKNAWHINLRWPGRNLVKLVDLFRCSACERLFNTVMELEHHKEEHGHWSDEEEESEEEEEEMEDLNGNQQVNLVYEEETIFGPEVEKRILLCSQDWLHFLNKSLQTMISGFLGGWWEYWRIGQEGRKNGQMGRLWDIIRQEDTVELFP